MNQLPFVSKVRSKKDIKRNEEIILACVEQKTHETPRSKCKKLRDYMNLTAEDISNNPSRLPPADARSNKFDAVPHINSAPLPSREGVPRSKADVLRNAMKFTSENPPVQPSRLPPAYAPRNKHNAKRIALKLSSVIPFVPTPNAIRYKDEKKRKAIKANDVLPNDIITDHGNLRLYNEKISKESNDSNRLCRFCLCKPTNAIRIAWHSWKDSKLALLYEQITNIKVSRPF